MNELRFHDVRRCRNPLNFRRYPAVTAKQSNLTLSSKIEYSSPLVASRFVTWPIQGEGNYILSSLTYGQVKTVKIVGNKTAKVFLNLRNYKIFQNQPKLINYVRIESFNEKRQLLPINIYFTTRLQRKKPINKNTAGEKTRNALSYSIKIKYSVRDEFRKCPVPHQREYSINRACRKGTISL